MTVEENSQEVGGVWREGGINTLLLNNFLFKLNKNIITRVLSTKRWKNTKISADQKKRSKSYIPVSYNLSLMYEQFLEEGAINQNC